MKCHVFAVVAVAVVCASFAADAGAACFSNTSSLKRPAVAPGMMVNLRSLGSSVGASRSDDQESIVGMWNVTFLFGDGPAVYDQGFQHWHSDHTELMVDNAVPPSFGNVCIGVWKQDGTRTYKLRHMTFNWDENGKLAGTFLLLMTVKLDRRGNLYSGTYVADSFDLAGNVIPEFHVEGKVRGTRITVD